MDTYPGRSAIKGDEGGGGPSLEKGMAGVQLPQRHPAHSSKAWMGEEGTQHNAPFSHWNPANQSDWSTKRIP